MVVYNIASRIVEIMIVETSIRVLSSQDHTRKRIERERVEIYFKHLQHSSAHVGSSSTTKSVAYH
jgi:hypothetical protein